MRESKVEEMQQMKANRRGGGLALRFPRKVPSANGNSPGRGNCRVPRALPNWWEAQVTTNNSGELQQIIFII